MDDLEASPGGYRRLGSRLSNWGRWGDSDRCGTLNLITPAERVRAAALVHTGQVVSLALPLDSNGPQGAHSERSNIVHVMTRTGETLPTASGYVFTDDAAFLHMQGATQLDGLAHVGYDGSLYNGVPLASVTSRGSNILGIDSLAGIQTRGILLDLPRHFGLSVLAEGTVVEAEDLERCAASQGITVNPGDAVLVRTGWMDRFLATGDGVAYLASEPGLGLSCAEWLRGYDVAFLASDNFGIEVVPSVSGDDFPLHSVLIRDMGMPLGEMLVLDELASSCTAHERWEFLFTCLALPIPGGVGSPIAPLATF